MPTHPAGGRLYPGRPLGRGSARWLKVSVAASYRRRATRSDFWGAYAEVFPRRTHRPRANQEGETCRVESLNGRRLRQRAARFVRYTLSFSK